MKDLKSKNKREASACQISHVVKKTRKIVVGPGQDIRDQPDLSDVPDLGIKKFVVI